MIDIQEYFEKYPEIGKKDYPEKCTVCGDALTDEDSIIERVNKIKSNYETNKKNAEKKGKKTLIPEIEKLNELIRLGRSKIKHDKCKGGSQYCAFDGSKLGIYGFSITEKGHQTSLICGLCGQTYQRPMNSRDAVIINPVSDVGKALLHSYKPQEVLVI